MIRLQPGDKVKGPIVANDSALTSLESPLFTEGLITSVLERTVVVQTRRFGKVLMKKTDLTILERNTSCSLYRIS